MLTSSRRSRIGVACGLSHQEEGGTAGVIATDMMGECRVERLKRDFSYFLWVMVHGYSDFQPLRHSGVQETP